MVKSGKFVVNKVEKKRCHQKTLPLPLEIGMVGGSGVQGGGVGGSISGGIRRSTQPSLTALQRLEFVLSTLNRLLIGFITIYMIWLCLRQKAAEIPWHACLCTLGFTCLMAEGLLAHYRGNACTQICVRPEKTRTHWLLQIIGSVLGIGGIVVKLLLEEVHFPTLHGKLGLAAFVLCLVSLASGLSALYANELRNWLQPLWNKTTHTFLGLATFTLAMLSMLTAFETELFVEYSLDAANFHDFRLVLEIATIFNWLLSIYGPIWCLIYSRLWKSC